MAKDGENTFWTEKSLEQLAAEQGVKPIRRFEDVFGRAARPWKDGADFEDFLAAVHGTSPAEA